MRLHLTSLLLPLPRVAFVLLTVAVVLTACAGTSSATGEPEGAWRLLRLGDVASTGPTLDFQADGRIAGHAGCNRYSASMSRDADGGLHIGPVAATKMACVDDGRMQAEAAFLAMLADVAGYRHSRSGELLLLDESGAVLAQFEPDRSGTD